jgi:hypothetical protein
MNLLLANSVLTLAGSPTFWVIVAGVGFLGFASRRLLARWFAAQARPFPRLFASITRLLLAGQTSDPAALRQRANFRVENWPTLGLMPEAVITHPVRRLIVGVLQPALSATMALPRNDDRCKAPNELRRFASRYFSEKLLTSVPTPREEDFSARRLYEQVSVAGFYHLRPNTDGTHSLDLQYLRDYAVRKGSFVCGGEAVVDLRAGRFVRLVTPEDRVVTPGDSRFGLEAFRFRSTLFQWRTIVPHSAWCHGIVGPKLFLATHALPETHPMRELLRPFVFKVHENVRRSRMSVFGKTGVLSNVGSLAPESVNALIAHGAYRTEIKNPAQMHMPAFLRAVVEPVWDALMSLVNGFLTELSISDDDPHVRGWRAFVAAHIHPDFRTLPLSEILTFCLFTNSLAHHLWGHIFNGSSDPRYISTMTRYTTATDEAGLMEATETRDYSVLRLSVIISVNRQVVKLFSNLAPSTDDSRARALFEEFSRRVCPVEKSAPDFLDLAHVATSGMI